MSGTLNGIYRSREDRPSSGPDSTYCRSCTDLNNNALTCASIESGIRCTTSRIAGDAIAIEGGSTIDAETGVGCNTSKEREEKHECEY